MSRLVLETFEFIPFTGIGFIAKLAKHPLIPTNELLFQFCFPLMVEKLYAEMGLSEKYAFLEPQAKFELSYGRKKWIETYYFANFLFKKEHEAEYDRWRRRFFSEIDLYFLEKYDEVEVPVCIITVLDPKEKSEEERVLIHDFEENFHVLTRDKNENLFVIPQIDGENNIIDYIDWNIKLKIEKVPAEKKRKVMKYKILYLNERFQKVFEEMLSKFEKEFGINLKEV